MEIAEAIERIGKQEEVLGKYSDELRLSVARVVSVFGNPKDCRICGRSAASEQHTGAGNETRLALAPFKELNVAFPRPEDYPVLWAIRQFHRRDGAPWPNLREIVASVSGSPWASHKYGNGGFIIKAVERLKAGYLYYDPRVSRYAITNQNDREAELRRSLVLMSNAYAGGPAGSVRYVQTMKEFLERYVEEKMPAFMAFMPPHADNVPDGIILAPKTDDQWDTGNAIAVEVHLEHHPRRAIDQAKKRFKQGYTKVIVVTTALGMNQSVLDEAYRDPELGQRLAGGWLEVTPCPTPRGEEAGRPAETGIPTDASPPPEQHWRAPAAEEGSWGKHAFAPRIRVSFDAVDPEPFASEGDDRMALAFSGGELRYTWYTTHVGPSRTNFPARKIEQASLSVIRQLVESGRLPKFIERVAAEYPERIKECARVAAEAAAEAEIVSATDLLRRGVSELDRALGGR